MAVLLKVRDWQTHFENNRTRELKHMDWVPIPNKLDGDGYTELLDHPDGAAHFGAWVALVEVASKCVPRGTLLRDGAVPHDSASLSRITRIRRDVFDAAIPRLISIGWLESEVVASPNDKEIPQEGATAPQEGAALTRARRTERKGTEGNGSTSSAGADASDDNAAEGKAKVQRANVNPERESFKSHFRRGWKARYGADYAWVRGKDDGHVTWVLNHAKSGEKAKAVADAYLATDDRFLVERRHPLGLLVSGFNRYATPESEPDDCPFPVNYDPPQALIDLCPGPQPVIGRPIE